MSIAQKLAFAVALTMVFPAVLRAQVTLWNAHVEAAQADTDAQVPCILDDLPGRSTATDGAGSTVVTGCAYDGQTYTYLTIKYSADGQILWSARHGLSGGTGFGRTLAIDQLGDVVVSGVSTGRSFNSDISTVKYDGDTGAAIWESRLNGTAGHDEPIDLAIDAAGDVFVTGFSTDALGNEDLVAIKIAGSTGDQLWLFQFDGEAAGNDLGNALALDAAGNVIVVGRSRDTINNRFVSTKLAGADGSVEWQSFYGSGNSSYTATSVVVDGDNDVVVVGEFLAEIGYDYALIKYDGNSGAELWSITEDGPSGFPRYGPFVVVDDSGDLAFAGSVDAPDETDFQAQKYDGTTGNLLWSRQYDGGAGGDDQLRALVIDQSGDYIVSGTVVDSSAIPAFMAIKLDGTSGAEKWVSQYRSEAESGDVVASTSIDASGDPVIVGTSQFTSDGRSDFAVLKLDGTDGGHQWRSDEGLVDMVSLFNCGGPFVGQRSLAIDPLGNAFVTGCIHNGRNWDYVTGKVAADGRWLWRKIYDGGGRDYAVALVLDSQGDVIVTGGSYTELTRVDYYTLKYDGDTGAELWSARYTASPSSGDQSPSGITLDHNDDIVVGGMTPTLGMGFAVAVIKYSGVSGEEHWVSGYNSFSGGVGQLVTDSAGDVVLTGQVGQSFTTMKFLGVDGALQWLAQSNLQLGVNGGAFSVAIDNSDNIVSTGTYYNVDQFDLATIKYDGSDGSVLWFSGDDGPASGVDRAYAVRINAFGDVLISGTAEVGVEDSDTATIKYRGTNGELVWKRYFGAESTSFQRASDLRIDAVGDVMVVGNQITACSFDQSTIVKYAGDTGEFLWAAPIVPVGGPVGSSIEIAADGSIRHASTARMSRGSYLRVSRIDEFGRVDRFLQDSFESGLPVPSVCSNSP